MNDATPTRNSHVRNDIKMPTKSITCQHKFTHIQNQLSWKVAATVEKDRVTSSTLCSLMTTSATVLLDPTNNTTPDLCKPPLSLSSPNCRSTTHKKCQ